MSKILDKYIKKVVFFNIFMVFFILNSFSFLFKFLEEIKKVEKEGYSIAESFVLIFFQIPKDFELFFLVSSTFGIILGLSSLKRTNELIGIQSIGFGLFNIFTAISKIVLFILCINFSFNEFFLPIFEEKIQKKKILSDFYLKNKSKKLIPFWIKEGNRIIYFEHNFEFDKIYNIQIYKISENSEIQKIEIYEKAEYKNNKWNFFYKKVLTNNLKNKNHFKKENKIFFNPKLLSIFFLERKILSMREMIQYIKYCKYIKKENKKYNFVFLSKIFFHIHLFVIAFFSVFLVINPLQKNKNNAIKKICIILFLFYLLKNFSLILYVQEKISLLISILITNLVFFLFFLFEKKNFSRNGEIGKHN
ncbi:LptF/LptG family permease [bacterium endosymbiont of Pedicinus badii]|uniref:LptF/LptG family permease n=1 Tax=bacterium endosymbiont of Pedicinus badii TaxID=1719126 RepID=UPI0009BA51A5|nr:LptF/LptG family permease [bacterium endosymbiont of Pedicinus badii]